MSHLNQVNSKAHPRSSVVRAPNRYLGGHGVDSRRGHRFFSFPTLVTNVHSIYIKSTAALFPEGLWSYNAAPSLLLVFSFRRHVAVGLVRTMGNVYQRTRRKAMCVIVRRDSQESIAKQVIEFSKCHN